MGQPTYVRRLLRQKWLLIVGAVVSLAAGLLAGFTIVDGQVQSRVVQNYLASSTVLLTSPNPQIYQVEIPADTQALPQPTDTTAPQELIVQEATPLNLSESAIVLAYLAASDEVVDATAAAVGGFEDGDGVTAVQRTTQPAGDERFGGRLSLPLIDVVGSSTSPERAELIAAEATTAFADLVVAEQTEWGVAEDIRLVLDEINQPVAGEGEGSNPAIPIIVVTVGVFLLFVALALIIEAVRESRRRRRDAGEGDTEDDPAADDIDETEATVEPETDPAEESDRDRDRVPVPAGKAEAVSVSTTRSSRRSRQETDTDLSALLSSEEEPAETTARR